MSFIAESLRKAVLLIVSGSPDVFSAVWTSLLISTNSILLASLLGVPAGVCIGVGEFRLKRILLTLLNSLLAMRTVVIGLLVYSAISRRGVFGKLEPPVHPYSLLSKTGQTCSKAR